MYSSNSCLYPSTPVHIPLTPVCIPQTTVCIPQTTVYPPNELLFLSPYLFPGCTVESVRRSTKTRLVLIYPALLEGGREEENALRKG